MPFPLPHASHITCEDRVGEEEERGGGEGGDPEAEGAHDARQERHDPPPELGHERAQEQRGHVEDEGPEVEEPGHAGGGRPEVQQKLGEDDAEAGAEEVHQELEEERDASLYTSKLLKNKNI